MSQFNVLIQSANIAFDSKHLVFYVEIAENQKIPNIRILGTPIETELLGFLIGEFLHTFELPTLNNVKAIPAILELEGDDWTLVNFLNDTKKYNAKDIRNRLLASIPTDEPEPSTGEGTDASAVGA